MVLLLMPLMAYARPCLEVRPDIENEYKIEVQDRFPDWSRSDCEASADNADMVLVAVPLTNQNHELLDLEIGAYDKRRSKRIARRLERGALESDAVYVDGLSLDRARYTLKKGRRAFGVRVRWRGSSSANPFSYETLSLFVLTGGTLARPLSGMVATSHGGEWDMQCDGEFSTVMRSIAVVPKKGDWAELVIRELKVDEKFEDKRAGCVAVRSERKFKKYRARYDGGVYALPTELSQ